MQNEEVGASPFFIAPGNENFVMQQPGRRERQGQRATETPARGQAGADPRALCAGITESL